MVMMMMMMMMVMMMMPLDELQKRLRQWAKPGSAKS
jgi:hypothetical protein